MTLPLMLQPSNVVKSWEKAGRPSVDTWLEQFSNDLRSDITKPKLLHSLRAGLSALGYSSISTYRVAQGEEVRSNLLFKVPKKEHVIPLEEKSPQFNETEDGAILASTTTTIRNQDELVKYCNIDLSIWKVDRCEIKTYQGFRKHQEKDITYSEGKADGYVSDKGKLNVITMYSVKVWLVPNIEKPISDIVDTIVERIKEQPKIKSIRANYPKGSNLFVPCIFDPHFNRRDLTATNTPQKTRSELIETGQALFGRAQAMGISIDKIMIPMTGDVLDTDNMHDTTTKGTPQKSMTDLREAAREGSHGYLDIIEQALQIAPVDVVIVGGNHDRLMSYMLGLVIEAYFANHTHSSYVTIRNSMKPREYYSYGVNLIGMEHGDEVKLDKLPGLMSLEAKEYWANAEYRTFFRGHFHNERSTYVPLADMQGVKVRVFPAFCPTNEWELLMGYIGNKRRAEGLFFNKENGPGIEFPVFVDEL